ncbi:membrane protein of unknown function [Candidatus Filomicrobium marinum]|uniref:Phage tail tape measure protein domain-containing protein n=1 Tax=Candidatus Filomicrobium marinum TaxID=1608628 RepID=A0A0D6JG46_9HYPH|nr:phage tail tape measure protein [Candidatus Filomicrobium marinum]CFX24569.1 membrane protein of unknown function [Candidatus Filomicrobium marinum]CPR19187.1 membrane protein of unknown function [Candidatus Filomicrobium marinum]
MSGFNVQILLKLVDQLTAPSKKIAASYRQMQQNITASSTSLNAATNRSMAGLNRMAGAANAANASVSRLATSMRNMRALSAGFTGLGLGGGGAAMVAGYPLWHMLKNAADYESKLIDLRKVWTGAESDYQRLVKGLKPLHGQLPLSRIEIGKVLEEGIRSGVSMMPSELLDFTKSAAAFSVAFSLPIEEAATKLAKIKSSLGLTMNEFTGVGDTMNTLANTMSTNEHEMLEFIRRVGGLAKSIGGKDGLNDVLAIGAAQMAAGTPKEVAATGLRTLLARLSTQPSDTKKALNALGLDPEEIKRQLPKDVFGTVYDLIDRISKASKEDQSGLLSRLAGMKSFDAFARLLTNTELMTQALKTVRGEFRLTMQSELIRRVNSLNAVFQITRNLLGDLSDSIVMAWRPQIVSILQTIQKLSLSMKDSPILQWTAAFFAGLAAFSLVLMPLGVLGASLYGVRLGMMTVAGAAGGLLRILKPSARLLSIFAAGELIGLFGALAGGARRLAVFTRVAYAAGGAVGVAAMAFRALRNAMGIGLAIEGVRQVYLNWDRFAAIAKDPIELKVLWPKMPEQFSRFIDWWSETHTGQMDRLESNRLSLVDDVKKWRQNYLPEFLGGAPAWTKNVPVPVKSSIKVPLPERNLGVPEAIARKIQREGQVGAPTGINVQANGPSVTFKQAPPNIINNVSVHVMQSNASPEAIGAAAASAIGSKVRGALSDAEMSMP